MNGELVGTLEKHKNGAHTFQYDKNLPDAIYLHKDAFSSLPDNLKQFIPAVAKAIKLDGIWLSYTKKSSDYLFLVILPSIANLIRHLSKVSSLILLN